MPYSLLCWWHPLTFFQQELSDSRRDAIERQNSDFSLIGAKQTWYCSMPQKLFFYRKPSASVSFSWRRRWTACYLALILEFLIVTPRMFTFSLEYVENVWGVLLLQPQMHINTVSPVWGDYGSNLGFLWLLGGDIKCLKVISGYRGFEPGKLGFHARMLTTAPLPPLQL